MLATDYDNYSVSISRPRFSAFTKDFLWVQSRTPTLKKEIFDTVRGIIAEALPDYDFDNVVHFTYQGEDCRYEERHAAPTQHKVGFRTLPHSISFLIAFRFFG